MTTENNNSANALIAEFMGMKPHDPKELDGFWTNTIKAHKFDNVMNLQFNSDWNWLMEVVHKITILEEFQEWEYNNLFWEVFCQLDITEIYNQVVLFIEYYNENSADKN